MRCLSSLEIPGNGVNDKEEGRKRGRTDDGEPNDTSIQVKHFNFNFEQNTAKIHVTLYILSAYTYLKLFEVLFNRTYFHVF